MKTLKLDHQAAQDLIKGVSSVTWRIYDDKNIGVNDQVAFIDKVDPQNPDTWKTVAVAQVDRVIEKRVGDTTAEDYGGGHIFQNIEEMLEHLRQRYGPQVDGSTPIKIIYFTVKENKNEDSITTRKIPKEAKLFADGGSRGNPGPSAGGFAIVDMQDTLLIKKGLYLGITTNNQAEYQALKFGLEEALAMGIQEIHVYMDSLLVVNQMRRIFKVKNRDLWPIHESIVQLTARFKHISFTHIPRELNKLADSMANEAMDAATV